MTGTAGEPRPPPSLDYRLSEVGVSAWFLGIAVVLTGIGSFGVGIVLGITHLVKAHGHGTAV